MEDKTLNQKIREIQNEIDPLVKDKEVSFGNTKYEYFDINQLLDNLLPLLNDREIALTQRIVIKDGQNVLKTVLSDDNDSIESEVILPERNDQQDFGSDLTYIRRYALQAMLGLRAEDDNATRSKGDSKKRDMIDKVDEIDNLKDLKAFYEKNKGQGKWFDKLVNKKKHEIKNT